MFVVVHLQKSQQLLNVTDYLKGALHQRNDT